MEVYCYGSDFCWNTVERENYPDPTPPPKGRPLYLSSDGGKSWKSISDQLPRTYAVPVRVHPRNSQTLYLGVPEEPPPKWLNRPTKANSALMRSRDGGASWEELNGGFPRPCERMVECIDFDPAEPDHVFVGVGGDGALDEVERRRRFSQPRWRRSLGKAAAQVPDYLRACDPVAWTYWPVPAGRVKGPPAKNTEHSAQDQRHNDCTFAKRRTRSKLSVGSAAAGSKASAQAPAGGMATG